MNKHIIFHLPFKISSSHSSGTNIRPVQMQQAFRNIGYEVEVIEGTAPERKAQIKNIKEKIRQGLRYDFLYSESSTEPTLLTGKNHLPLYPFLDFGFFRFCRKYKIPIGLFYRDIYWRFPFYGTHLPFWKRSFAKAFYRYDVRKYRHYLSILYLPSFRMKAYLPAILNSHLRIEELPPAAPEVEISLLQPGAGKTTFDILYVGGIGGHYEISNLFAAVRELEGVRLTVCCRRSDWENNVENYRHLVAHNIEIVHKQKEELKVLFEKADLTAFFVNPGVYVSFAIPLKIFEYMAYEKPVVVSRKTASADFVEEHGTGWAIDYSAEALRTLISQLKKDKRLMEEKKTNIRKIIQLHTWEARARKVAKDLTKQ